VPWYATARAAASEHRKRSLVSILFPVASQSILERMGDGGFRRHDFAPDDTAASDLIPQEKTNHRGERPPVDMIIIS
jgi:hypothetical protein